MFKFEKFINKKEDTDMSNMPESFKDLDYFMKTGLLAKPVEHGENYITYETDLNIEDANWYANFEKERPDLKLTSEAVESGKYRVTLALKQLVTDQSLEA